MLLDESPLESNSSKWKFRANSHQRASEVGGRSREINDWVEFSMYSCQFVIARFLRCGFFSSRFRFSFNEHIQAQIVFRIPYVPFSSGIPE
jgi:hypothetical protein